MFFFADADHVRSDLTAIDDNRNAPHQVAEERAFGHTQTARTVRVELRFPDYELIALNRRVFSSTYGCNA